MMRATIAAILALPLLAAAKDSKDPLAGYRVAGPAERCVQTSTGAASGFTISGDNLITYRETGKRLWVARPATSCTRMRWDDTLIVDQWGTQVCRGDRFRVLNRGMSIPSAYCIFGDFVPYEKVVTPKG